MSMAGATAYACSLLITILVLILLVSSNEKGGGGGYCDGGVGTLSFDIHHRFSDHVKRIMGVDDRHLLPDMGTLQYYAVMAHRDRLMITRGRRGLLSSSTTNPLTFLYGNQTYLLSSLGFLHYANVSVGTPEQSFFVALDTGSDLFWLPCNCTSCVRGIKTSSGQIIDLNIYNPSTSSTSSSLPCNSSLCSQQTHCSSATSDCPYLVQYLSNGTVSSGFLVQDYLHLISDDTQKKTVNAKITVGCGQYQTGSFLDGAAPNGLFGLGMTNISVPTTLASQGYTSNSFSMCFGSDGIGRIGFGDKGYSDQGETPFNLGQSPPTYNITITKIDVGGHLTSLTLTAIFDSGTSFTYLNNPAYSLITATFNKMVNDTRHILSSDNSGVPFEYCYDMSSNQTEFLLPMLAFTMQGRAVFNVTDPIVVVSLPDGTSVYCLGVVESGDVNIIGQNFMTGYNIVFDREREILGWKKSDCYGDVETNSLPISPSSAVSPPGGSAVNPQATSQVSGGDASPAGNHSPQSNPLTCTLLLLIILAPFFVFV